MSPEDKLLSDWLASGGQRKLEPGEQQLLHSWLQQTEPVLPSNVPGFKKPSNSPGWSLADELADEAFFGTLSEPPSGKPAPGKEAAAAAASREALSRTLAKHAWEQANPGYALMSRVAARSAIPTALAATGNIGADLAGVPELAGAVGGNWLTRAAAQAIPGAWQGGLTAATNPSATPEDVLQGVGIGAATGPLASVLGAPMRSTISPEVATMARKWQGQGLPLATAQIPGAPLAARATSRLLQLRHPEDSAALTQALMRSTGSDEPLLNFANIEAAKRAAGGQLDMIATRVPQIGDAQLNADLLRTTNAAHTGIIDPNLLNQFHRVFDPIYQASRNGTLDGQTFQTLTQKGSALWNAADRTSPIRYNAMQLRDNLYDALQRADPQAAADIVLARNQYRNAVTLEPLEDETTGIANPKKVMSAVKSNYDTTGRASQAATGAANPVDLGVLAEGAQNFIRPSQQGLHVGPVTAGGLGAAGAVAAEEGGLPLMHLAAEHPYAALAGGGLLGTYGLGGGLMNTPWGRNLLLMGASRNFPPLPNPAIPAAVNLYQQPGPTKTNAAMADYIQQAARVRGIDPGVALRVAQSEGLGAYTGDQGSSFGPFQLHYGNVAPGGNKVSGLGDVFTARTGLDARNPSTVPAQIDFALDYARAHGWGPWHGWKGDPFAGIGTTPGIPVAAGGVTVTPTGEWQAPQGAQ